MNAHEYCYCSECGSRDVQAEAWCSLNPDHATGEPAGTLVDWSQGQSRCENYCNDCADHVELTYDRREAAAARLAKRRERAA